MIEALMEGIFREGFNQHVGSEPSLLEQMGSIRDAIGSEDSSRGHGDWDTDSSADSDIGWS